MHALWKDDSQLNLVTACRPEVIRLCFLDMNSAADILLRQLRRQYPGIAPFAEEVDIARLRNICTFTVPVLQRMTRLASNSRASFSGVLQKLSKTMSTWGKMPWKDSIMILGMSIKQYAKIPLFPTLLILYSFLTITVFFAATLPASRRR